MPAGRASGAPRKATLAAQRARCAAADSACHCMGMRHALGPGVCVAGSTGARRKGRLSGPGRRHWEGGQRASPRRSPRGVHGAGSKGLEPDAAESESDTGFSRPHLFMVRRGWQGLGAGCRRAVGGRRRRSEAGALAVWRGALFPDGRGWPCCGSAACKQLVGLRGWSCSCVQAAGGAAWLVMQLRASSWWSLISCVIGAIAARNPQTVANAPQHTPTDSCSLPFGI